MHGFTLYVCLQLDIMDIKSSEINIAKTEKFRGTKKTKQIYNNVAA